MKLLGAFETTSRRGASFWWNFQTTRGITVPLWIAIAPYSDPDNNPATVAAYNAANTAQVIDLWIHDLYYSPTSFTPALRQHQAYIAAFNAATGANCQLYAYEGGIETC